MPRAKRLDLLGASIFGLIAISVRLKISSLQQEQAALRLELEDARSLSPGVGEELARGEGARDQLAAFASSNSELLARELELALQSRGRSHVAPALSLGSFQSGSLSRRLGNSTSQLAAHGSTSAHGSSAAHGSSSGHGAAHQHDALIFLLIALLVGTSITHLTTVVESLHSLPYTVVLFILGMVYSATYYGAKLEGALGVFGRSHDMWMQIDPHLLLFTLLPALLTGDAMIIDTTVAKRVAAQCIYLAGPGVLVSSALTGLFLYEFMGNWPFMLCLTMGAILAATDPVAVVGLLKELGASPTLTVQIQGESLLNDGTAIVLFKVTYDILCGTEYDFKGILILGFQMVVCSWFLGMIIGGIFSSWISAASNRLDHHSSLIQIALTICCAYCSFIFAEGILGISGVLSTVAASLVLADNIWPKIVSADSMHEVWHMLEYIGNTLIFFLAGALTGKIMTQIDPLDFIKLLVIYVVIMFIRLTVIFLSRPILGRLSPDRAPVTLENAVIMTWGGLRGAVGLALAIQVSTDRAKGTIEQAEADRVMFFTGGIAALTLCVNATTCPKLMDLLGLTATEESKKRMMLNIHERLREMSIGHPEKVSGIINALLNNIEHHIQLEYEVVENPSSNSVGNNKQKSKHGLGHSQCQCGGKMFPLEEKVLANFYQAKDEFAKVSEHCRELLGWSNDQALLLQEQDLLDTLRSGHAESSTVRAVNEAYLSLLHAEYWGHIKRGEFVDGTRTAEILLSSSTSAFQFAEKGLADWQNVQAQLGLDKAGDDNVRKAASNSTLARLKIAENGVISRIVSSFAFKFTMVLVILVNTIFIVAEDSAGSDQSVPFLVIDCFFMLAYIVEFVLKLSVMRLKYFSDGWNALDFMCVVLGLFGVAFKIAVEMGSMSQDSLSSEMQLVRLNRVFKLMRLLRVVVVVKFTRKLIAKWKGNEVSGELGGHLEIIFTLRAFVQAHISTQSQLLRFLGCASGEITKFDECEEARCILESWTQVYKALVHGAAQIEKVEETAPWMLGGMAVLRVTSSVVEDLTEFVVSAAHAGILKEGEAESIMHPMQRHLKNTNQIFADCHSGIHRTCLKTAFDSGFTRSVSPEVDDYFSDTKSNKSKDSKEETKPNGLNGETEPNGLNGEGVSTCIVHVGDEGALNGEAVEEEPPVPVDRDHQELVVVI